MASRFRVYCSISIPFVPLLHFSLIISSPYFLAWILTGMLCARAGAVCNHRSRICGGDGQGKPCGRGRRGAEPSLPGENFTTELTQLLHAWILSFPSANKLNIVFQLLTPFHYLQPKRHIPSLANLSRYQWDSSE
jgi:hypothetical protein